MPTIRDLFDPTRALNRPIEKVITYQNRSDQQLRTEISEYVVTDRIEQNFQQLLSKMQSAKQSGGNHEIGVWVSGFYGSGKSSFTKYLGFSLDRSMTIGGDRFIDLLKNQIPSAGVKAMFNQVSSVYDAAVIFLDLASEMLAGASMEDISTVLYLKVLQWAGYSEDLKVAELELMLERDGKLDEFKARAREQLDGIDWIEVHNQPLVANQIAAQLATEFYPILFKSAADFANLTLHVNKAENKRSEEMLDLIKRKSGKANIVFIIDEVGQYVSAKPSLILNLDGLAKNLKHIGGGSVWIFATAQQTLTDDNPTAALNSPGLYKLKDRFPVQVHLEPSDIKEICHKRLLTKSANGEQELNRLFDQYGPSLRTSTQLTDAGVYQTELTKKTFVDLYPFLPAHFEIILQLLGRLAKKTGGLGLRSAIKVIQEVLIEYAHGQGALADAPAGKLANTVTFYDSLRRDIEGSFPHIVDGVRRVAERMPDDPICNEVAKSIAVLQILENLPVTVPNIAALMQTSVDTPSRKDAVEKAVSSMLGDNTIPLGEKNGSLRFLTQAAVTLQLQFDQIEYRNADVRAELNSVLRSIFNPPPSARLAQVRPVSAGIRVSIGGGQSVSLEGEKEPIQIHVGFEPEASYETARTNLEIDSRAPTNLSSIYLLGRTDPDADQLAVTLVRCRKFLDAHRTATDPETQEFIRIIDARLQRTTADLERRLSTALIKGSFIAHGAHGAVATYGTDVQNASRAFLAPAAARVFDRYGEAAVQADATLAERFLKAQFNQITKNEDPLALVVKIGGQAQVNLNNLAIVSIADFLRRNGQPEGRRILDHFAAPPYGWSKDTTRYLLAAAFLGGLVKLRIAGQDHLVRSDESLAAFASNRSFGAIGVSLREERPDPDALMRASERLRDLSGENVLPLEDEIATAAKKHFPAYQAAFGPLSVELRNLGLPAECIERMEALVADLTEVVSGDGSDAIRRLGGVESPFHQDLLWSRGLKKSLDNGLRELLARIQRLRSDIDGLPESGVPGTLRTKAAPILAEIADILRRSSFFTEGAALAHHSDALGRLIADTVAELARQQELIRTETLERWEGASDWQNLDTEKREWVTKEVGRLAKSVTEDADGLRNLLNHDFTLNHRLRELGSMIERQAAESRAQRNAAKPESQVHDEEPSTTHRAETLILPASLDSASQVRDLIEQLKVHLAALESGAQLRLTYQILTETK